MAYIIGVDIGGTFTDCVVMDPGGGIHLGKTPSTPPDFATGFVGAIASAAERLGKTLGELLAETSNVFHGCTVGTNALVEGRTPKVAWLTTAGHSESLYIMALGNRLKEMPAETIARVAWHTKPEPLVPRQLVGEIHERTTFDGNALVELNETQARAEIAKLLDRGAEAFAVSFLWSTANNRHERLIGGLLSEMAPNAFVSLSSDVVRRAGEYERTVATIINTLVGPAMVSYLDDVRVQLEAAGYGGPLSIMSCSGGMISLEQARRLPLLTIGSGPVAGVIGSRILADADDTVGHRPGTASEQLASGLESGPNIITTDMGGTTFDVSIIADGRLPDRVTTRFGQWEYYVPTVDVRSVGSGGGSIIRYHPEGATLRVGPESAGARPGPAAYGAGGEHATVTDADLVLGYLDPTKFLGGAMQLDVDAARAALARAGAPLGFTGEQTAAAAARIVDSQMADAIRLVTVNVGRDPRDFILYIYGGAGGMHAPALAKELGIGTLVLPLRDLASVWSAFGVAASDAVSWEEESTPMSDPFPPDVLNSIWAELEGRAREGIASHGIDSARIVLERFAEIRYQAQINNVRVPAPDGDYDAQVVKQLINDFEEEYERLLGKGVGYAGAGFFLNSLTVRARAPMFDLKLGSAGDVSAPPPEPVGHRDVIWYEHGLDPQTTPVYDGALLTPGAVISGPAIAEFSDTTLVLRHGQEAATNAYGNIVIQSEV